MDKVPVAVVILVGTFAVAVIAGFNQGLGKVLFAYFLIVAMVWLIGGGTQTHLTKWESILSGAGTTAATSGVEIL